MSDQKKPQTSETVEYTPVMQKMIQDAVMAAVAATNASNQSKIDKAFDQSRPMLQQQFPTCPDCRQALGDLANDKDPRGCKGKHRKLVVLPGNRQWADDFPGVKVNGVMYRSSHYGEAVTVPAASDIENLISSWEQAEHSLRHGSGTGKKGLITRGG